MSSLANPTTNCHDLRQLLQHITLWISSISINYLIRIPTTPIEKVFQLVSVLQIAQPLWLWCHDSGCFIIGSTQSMLWFSQITLTPQKYQLLKFLGSYTVKLQRCDVKRGSMLQFTLCPHTFLHNLPLFSVVPYFTNGLLV